LWKVAFVKLPCTYGTHWHSEVNFIFEAYRLF